MSIEDKITYDEKFANPTNNFVETGLIKLKHFLDNENLCDVILIAGNDQERFPAHRIVLSAASKYFATMFFGSLCEAREKEVIIKEIDGEILKKLINHCYTGHLDHNKDHVQMLFEKADLLQLDIAVKNCCQFMISNLHPSNCLGVITLAEKYNNLFLLDSAVDYACLHFEEVCKTGEFLHLSAEILKKLLENDNIEIDSEESVFYTLKSWTEHDAEKRIENVGSLLETIRLSFLSPSFLDEIENYFELNDRLEQFIAFKCHVLPKHDSRSIRGLDKVLSSIMFMCGMGSYTIKSYCYSKKTWNLLENLSITKSNFSVTTFDGKLLIIGGKDSRTSRASNEIRSFDWKTHSWTTFPSMSYKKEFSTAVVWNGELYVIGGKNKREYLNCVEVYNPTSNGWRTVGSLGHKRAFAGCAFIGGHAYVVGGMIDTTLSLNSVECFECIAGVSEWHFKTCMNQSRASPAVAVLGSYLYAIGGHNIGLQTKTVERYDPTTDTWTYVAPLSIARSQIQCITLKNRLIAIGGFDGTNYLNIIEEYNPTVNKWRRLYDLPNAEAIHHIW